MCEFLKDENQCKKKCMYGNYCNKHKRNYLVEDNIINYEKFTNKSSDYLKDDILSSSLSGSWGPMMTTVGFYRQHADGTMDTQPLMVAKYPQAIMIRKDIDLILKIRIDI